MVQGRKRGVRYGDGDNAVLRSALWNTWGQRCYWCTEPVEWESTEIDHIIPQDVGDARLAEVKAKFKLADDFHLHDPHNLAPICRKCNGPGRKGSVVYDAPVLKTLLDRASKRRSAVISRVGSFGASGRLNEHLQNARMADLSDQAVREEFERHAPALIRILSDMDYQSFDLVDVVLNRRFGEYQTVDVSLDRRGRVAKELIEEVCGDHLDGALRQPVVQLVKAIYGRVQSAFEAIESDDPISAGEPVSDDTTISVDSVDFERTDRSIRFTFRGHFAASMTASLLRSDSRGDGLEELQGDAVVSGTFDADVYWAFAGFDSGDCFIDHWEIDL